MLWWRATSASGSRVRTSPSGCAPPTRRSSATTWTGSPPRTCGCARCSTSATRACATSSASCRLCANGPRRSIASWPAAGGGRAAWGGGGAGRGGAGHRALRASSEGRARDSVRSRCQGGRVPTSRLEIPPCPSAPALALERELGVSFAVAQVLVRRGLGDAAAARAWLDAADRQPPPGFCGIDEAVALVLRHAGARSRITVHGDYDVDGVASTAILVRALRAVGADV